MHATATTESTSPDRQLPIIEPVDNNQSVQQAHELVLRRIAHYEAAIERCKQSDQSLFSEEHITLQDGGRIHSGSTPEGRFYYVTNTDNQWMFLERSADHKVQTLLISENSTSGPRLTQHFFTR